MKRFLWLLTLIVSICAILLFTVSLPFDTNGPDAAAGVVDFSEADFERNVYKLSGQWEFYYGRLYTPGDFRAGVPEGMEYALVPGPWTSLGYQMEGYGTYRLTVQTGSDRPLLLYIPEIMSASTVWVNGECLFEGGRVGTSAEDTVPGIRNELLTMVPQNETLELVIQAANFHIYDSGLFYPVLIGRDTVLTHRIFWQRILVAAALGGILLMGIYHLFLYSFRRQETLYLTFSLTCLVTVFRLSMETNNLIQYFLPGGMNRVLSRVFLMAFTAHSLCLCVFMLQAFSIRLGRRLGMLCIAAFLIPMVMICMPWVPFGTAVAGMFLTLIPCFVSVVLVVRSGKAGRDPYRLLYLSGMIIFMFYGPLSKTVFEGDLFVPAIVPNMYLLLSQCVMLSRDYAEARNEAERMNENLEQLVEQRTEQLYDANRRLYDTNDRLRCANEQLAASQAALKEMISNISHDLKTPLTVLNNYLELLGDNTIPANDQERAEYLGIAYHKNLDLQRLIHNLFEVTRMEGGTVVYHLESVNASRLMREAKNKYADLVQDNGVDFSAGAEEDVELMADINKIWSVLDNLVYNAIRHTSPGGSISLGIRKNGGYTEFTVADTGEGIAPEHLPHIFERFYKVSPERGEKDGSSGLGLYIVKTAVEAMGGTIDVESVLGKGTVFRMRYRQHRKEEGQTGVTPL